MADPRAGARARRCATATAAARAARLDRRVRAPTCGSARPTARSATSTPRSSPTASGSSAGLWTGESLPRCGPPRRGSSATCATLRRASPTRRDHPAGLRDPRARDPRGRPARHAQRRRRAVQRRGRARDRRVAGGDRGRRRHAARVLAERGALAPVETGLLRLRRELAAIRRAHGGELAGARRRSAATERQRLNGRLGAGPGAARPAARRARDHLSARDPGAAAVKVNRRRFLDGLGARARRRRGRRAVAAGRRRAGRAGRRDLARSGSRSTGPTRPAS